MPIPSKNPLVLQETPPANEKLCRHRPLLEQYAIEVMDCTSSFSTSHSHEFLELAYVMQGSAEHTFNDRTRVIRPGDYFIVDYGEKHGYHRIGEEPLLLINVLFLPRFIDETLRACTGFQELLQSYLIRFSYASLFQPPTQYIFSDDTGEIRSVIDQMRTEFQQQHAGFTEMLRSLMIRIFILTMRKIQRDDMPCPDGVVALLTDYVRHHYSEDICLGSLCQSLHYSPAYISKKFHDETGTPFSLYVQKYRMEQSCRLLANSNEKIHKIAESVGYTNTKYFTEIFRRHIGCTPRDYRRLHKT